MKSQCLSVLITSLVVVFFTTSCQHLAKNRASIYQEKIINIMNANNTPGLAIAQIKNKKLLSIEYFGLKNKDEAAPIDCVTVFEAASLSKPVFAYAVLRLVEKGQFDLDKPLFQYYSYEDLAHDEKAQLITARMVLSHFTGLPNWRPDKTKLMVYNHPGKNFSYSGEGYFFLQKVIEKISGLSLADFMRESVFEPLGMAHSSYIWRNEYKENKATAHNNKGMATNIREPKKANAAATLHTTAEDYAKFLITIMNKIGIKPTTLSEMLTPQIRAGSKGPFCIKECKDTLSPSIAWGLGFGIQQLSNEKQYWHWGNNRGYRSYFFFNENGDGMIFFTNGAGGENAIKSIIELLTKESHPSFDWLRAGR